MCGIVGYTGGRYAAPIVLDGLKKLEYRGYDSAGIAVTYSNNITINKVSGRISNLCEKTENGRNMSGNTGIGHTRWATHGAPTKTNAHPHKSNNGRFAVVHNGIIENYQELRDELIENGYYFESDTDTEVIVHLLDWFYKGDLKKTVMKATSCLQGSYALGIICVDEPDTIYVVRESSPLIIGLGVGENYFASDVTALVSYTKNVIYMEDGEIAKLSPDSIGIYNCSGEIVNKRIHRITWDVQAAEKGGYEHYMLKEIMEQPRAVESTISPRIHNQEICLDTIEFTKYDMKNIRRIVITACGSAYYAGCAGKYAIEKFCKIPVHLEIASELRYDASLIDEHTLVILLSQSGETADTIAAMKICQKHCARTLAIVNVVGSTIAKLADDVLYTWAGPEIAVATTKGYTTQVAVLYILAVYFGKITGKITEEEYENYVTQVQNLPKEMQQTLDMNAHIEKLAKKYCSSRSIFYIGRNTDYAIALEGALKMKEISYIHAESYPAGELKHGTIALIREHQPIIALCCNEEIMDKTINNINELKTRGAEVLVVTRKGNQKMVSIADDIILIPNGNSLFSAVLEIIPLQLLAYYVAKENYCDIDKPKNLAKSVTVE